MKVAPLHRAFLRYHEIVSKLVHTGQHYHETMSTVFLDQLELPRPDYALGVSSGSPTQQMASIMMAFEKVVAVEKADLVLVVGDVNSTLACALAAVKMGIPVAHVEAGLRSSDRRMPEEINRILTDSIAEFLFVTERAGLENLRKEGILAGKIHFTGNCMIDSLVYYREKSARLNTLKNYGLFPKSYVLVTFHRPSNVDTKEGLENILDMIEMIVKHQTVVFPVHPRTQQNFDNLGLAARFNSIPNLQLLAPQGYLEFLQLMAEATAVLTDSGGIQEETTYLQVPCVTFRETTERPVTVEIGTNELISNLNPELALEKIVSILNGNGKQGQIPELWDGKAAERIAEIIYSAFHRNHG